jgi:DNA-binding protein HU-beta
VNRAELVTAVAEKSGQSKSAVEDVLGVLGDVVGDAVVAGDKVTLPGLLTAEKVDRAERQGRNPQTGESLTIAASSGVKLSAVTALKNKVKNG